MAISVSKYGSVFVSFLVSFRVLEEPPLDLSPVRGEEQSRKAEKTDTYTNSEASFLNIGGGPL